MVYLGTEAEKLKNFPDDKKVSKFKFFDQKSA